MPLEFTCPHCGGRTLVDDDYLGHSGPCFQCGKPVTVPLRPLEAPQAAAEHRQRNRQMWLSSVLVVLAGIVTGVITVVLVSAFVWPLISTARSAAQQATCSANLRTIAAALQRYHDQHGSYPPPYFTDATGKPQHSWRVLILPQLGEQALYDQYRFDEPWDGPNNFALQMRMPAVYGCPADPNVTTRSDTSYLAIVGSRTVFPPNGARKASDIRDGAGNTILIAECHESAIPWTAPRDISSSSLSAGVNGPNRTGIQSQHELGAYVVLVDGTVEFVSENASREDLESLSTVAGHDSIDWQRLTGRD